MNQPLWAAASFSARIDGNCARFLEVLALAEGAENIDRIDLNAYTFGPCGPCEYVCTKGRACTLEDDFAALRERLFAAQRVLFALPAYDGRFPARFYTFLERIGPYLHRDTEKKAFYDRLGLILVACRAHGGTALARTAAALFKEAGAAPRVLLISAQDCGLNALRDDLAAHDALRADVEKFITAWDEWPGEKHPGHPAFFTVHAGHRK